MTTTSTTDGERTTREPAIDVRLFDTRAALGAAAVESFVAVLDEVLARTDTANVVFASAPSQQEFLTGLASARVPWSRVRVFHLDEYIGLPATAPHTFGQFLRDRLFERIASSEVHYLDGNATNADSAGVKVVDLDLRSREQQVHDGCFPSVPSVPVRALTLTISAIMAAGGVPCVVTGPTKAGAVRDTLLGPVTTACPASVLRQHEDATLFLDRKWAALLPR